VRRSEPNARIRFRENDAYRVDREWLRLEGTAQRDLFREIRARFLARHRGRGRWALDAGSGPGRFTIDVGASDARRVAADIGREALVQLKERWPAGVPTPDRVRSDLVGAPFAEAAFGTVVALGNLVGFAGPESEHLIERLVSLVGPTGTILLEIAPGPGERSRYLRRLPTGAVGRLLRAPTRAILPRVTREGFDPVPARRRAGPEFRRWDPGTLAHLLEVAGFDVREIRAVAPTLGADPERIEAIAHDPVGWAHLLELEESVGGTPARWPKAAAVLLAAERRSEG